MYLPISRCISPHLAISLQAERRAELDDAAQLADQIENLVAEVAAQQARTAEAEAETDAVKQRVRREKLRNATALSKYGDASRFQADQPHTLRLARRLLEI